MVAARADGLQLQGLSVTPHLQSKEMRYRREPDFSLGARVELFLRNPGNADLRFAPDAEIRLRGKSPDELLAADEWAWHDFPSAWTNAPLVLPPGTLTVWSFNGKRAPWGAGQARRSASAAGRSNSTLPSRTRGYRRSRSWAARRTRSRTRSSSISPIKPQGHCAWRAAISGCRR